MFYAQFIKFVRTENNMLNQNNLEKYFLHKFEYKISIVSELNKDRRIRTKNMHMSSLM